MTCKALLIGINYTGNRQGLTLKGCANDARRLRDFVCAQQNATVETRLLTDDLSVADTYGRPTKRAILRAIDWLTDGATADSQLWFSFAGHGSHVRDESGDERDGNDEVLVPCDYQKNGFIRDDELRRHLCDRLPRGARLFALFDQCHSGTALDLKITLTFDNSSNDMKKSSLKKSRHCLVAACAASVVTLSACQDSECAEEARQADGIRSGALTYSFLRFVGHSSDWHSLLHDIAVWLSRRHYRQRPMLSFGNSGTPRPNDEVCLFGSTVTASQKSFNRRHQSR